jgi:hypothetical protein
MKALFSVIILVFMAIVIVGCSDQNVIPTIQEKNNSLEVYKSRQSEIDLVDLKTLNQVVEQIIASDPGLTDKYLAKINFIFSSVSANDHLDIFHQI